MTGLLGHDQQLAALRSKISDGKLHHALLLAGPRGVGKATFARVAAAMIVDPDGNQSGLTKAGTHPDILTITRPNKDAEEQLAAIDPDGEKKRSINVKQIRKLLSMLANKPALSSKRAVIVDSADEFEVGASNALLKSLEEPPDGCHFLLVTHSSDRLLPTIRSRCQMLRFEPLDSEKMRTVLSGLLPDAPPEEIESLLGLSGGAPGIALEFAGLGISELEAEIEKIIDSGDPDNHIRSQLAAKLALKAAQPRYEAFLRRVPARIAEFARHREASKTLSAIEAWKQSTELAARALGLSLDKNVVVLQMGSLLAGLNRHKPDKK